MTKYINANIKSKKELAQRLSNGEVFYTPGNKYKLYFKESSDGNPFALDCASMNGAWSLYKELLIKKEWYEDLTEPMLCYVSDVIDGDFCEIKFISEFVDEKFIETHSFNKWKYATPIATLSELNKLQEEKK